MKWLVFTLVMLMSSVCYGQLPIGQDKVLVLVVSNKTTCNLSRDAERHFSQPDLLRHLDYNDIQLVKCYGEDFTAPQHKEWGITHYPAVVYLLKKDGKLVKNRTVSGLTDSVMLGRLSEVRNLVGMNNPAMAETTVVPPGVTMPLPQTQAQTKQYVVPQQQYQYSAPSS